MKRLMKNEKGQALILTLLLLLIGSLIISPTLSLMGTGLRSGRVYEQKNDEIYAADAGIEDAMWRIRNDTLSATLSSVGYNQYDYSSNYTYPFNLFVNSKNVTVSIQNIWLPTGISTPDAATARSIIDDEKLMIVGYPDIAASTYAIKIVYYWQGSNALNIKTLGILLASGYEYSEYSGSCSLQGQTWYRAPTISLDKGGCAVVWNLAASPNYPLLSSFPGGTSGNPLVRTFTFKYTGPQGQIPELVGSWVDTTGVPGTSYSYSWDDTIRLHKIASQAGGIQIDAYGAKTQFRKLKTTISGDYYGTGNSFITGMEDPYNNMHYLLHRSAQAAVATNDNDHTLGVPSDAEIDAAYLYWTGWIDWNTYHPSSAGSQTRYPSGDISSSGTWDKTASMYSYVDESGTHDGDTTYLRHGTSYGNVLFSFPAFTVNVPGDMAIELTVSLVARDDTSGTNKMRPWIRVGTPSSSSSYYGTYTEVPNGYGTISYAWMENPQTGLPWTQDQINGAGSNSLQSFGVTSNDANPQIRLTQVYAKVNWGASLRYPAAPAQQNLQVLVENTARVNTVYFKGGSGADTLITTHDWETLSPAMLSQIEAEGTWYYTCKADVTDLLKQWIDEETIQPNGVGTYTVSHVAAPNEADPSYSFSFATGGGSTGYPLGTPAPEQDSPPSRYCLSHAGWSLLILYHCASVFNHQYYLYDIDTPGFGFFFGWGGSGGSTVYTDWDNDGNPGGTISGFLVPPQTGEPYAARITVLVGEGDKANGSSSNGYCKDRFQVNGSSLSDGTGLPDVWNGNSRGLSTDAGMDIDHFFAPWSVVKPMDVSAQIDLPTATDAWTVSYMLLQFSSKLGAGGVVTNYSIRTV